jgi:uncharacterized FlaG/YvyC family protein
MPDLQLSGVAPVAGAGSNAAAAAPPAGSKTAAPTPLPLATVPAAGDAPAAATAGTKPPGTDPTVQDQVKAAAKEAVKGANAAMAASGTLLVFVFDDQAHHMAVKVLDVQTQKVVQQIPLQHMPATASALAGDSPSGVLVDTKA